MTIRTIHGIQADRIVISDGHREIMFPLPHASVSANQMATVLRNILESFERWHHGEEPTQP